MRVLVTCGAGFIGSHFAKRLRAAGDEVIVLDKLTYSGNRANVEGADVEFVEGDIADHDAVAAAAAGCDAIVNFAAESHVDRSILGATEFIETDVLGTYVLLDWVREHGTRFVQVSTDEVYGDVPPGVSSREDDQLRPSSAFVTKSGMIFSGYWFGPYVFEPRVIVASTPYVRTYASTWRSPPAFEAE